MRVRQEGLSADDGRVNILFGGLTERHNQMIHAAGRGLGYRGYWIPTPTRADYETGRRFGNPGMCNPAYFTVGALVNYLIRLRDEQGVPLDRILREYVFVTAGAMGPCRFGMYESEFRLALRHAGFDGFRVLVFQQKGGISQSVGESALEVDLGFVTAMLTSVALADILNDLARRIRPYERVEGQANAVLERAAARLAEALREWAGAETRPGAIARMMARRLGVPKAAHVQRALDLARGRGPLWRAVHECAAAIDDGVAVDYTQVRPVCKIVGEFWAQRVEGDANFDMFAFLEGQGAEVHVEPLLTWFDYLASSAAARLRDERRLKTSNPFRRLMPGRREFALGAVSWMMRRCHDRFRAAFGGKPGALPDQRLLRKLAAPFYNPRLSGGEGHLEVGETLYYGVQGRAHGVIGLKPFGCLPSTQSDAVQAAVTARYPGLVYVPIETSGKGEVQALSRAQMALGDARDRCEAELDESLARTGYTMDEVRCFVESAPALVRPLYKDAARPAGVAGTAAAFVLSAARRMSEDPHWVKRSSEKGLYNPGDARFSPQFAARTRKAEL